MKRKDTLWLFLITIYILAGIRSVPFHGDESTTIWMSRDYGYIFLQHDLEAVRFIPPPLRTTEQHMRLITGSITKYLMGLAWQLGGYETEQINEQWDWGGDWDYNHDTGHAPDERLLFLARSSSAIMLALGASVIFIIGLKLDGRRVAYISSFYYMVNPALLLNGRRAMFEGGLVLFSLLTILSAIWFLEDKKWRSSIILGIMSGLALSAKHTALFTLIPVFTVCSFIIFRQIKTEKSPDFLLKTILAGGIALTLFYAIHPVWWGNPFIRVTQVIEARSAILEDQVAAFGGYENKADQFAGFMRQAFIVSPQYYEVPVWDEYISNQIHDYEKLLLAGLDWSNFKLIGVIMALLSCLGLWLSIKQTMLTYHVMDWLFVIWSLSIVFSIAIITPIEWQRYYIIVYLPIGLLMARGVTSIIDYFSNHTKHHQNYGIIKK